MIDVAVFAGGKGSRLAGLWHKSKFLVPVAGVPLIDRLMARVLALSPRRVTFMSDERTEELIGHAEESSWYSKLADGLFWSQESAKGTASALRKAVASGDIAGDVPLLLLNHDTLPRYDLADLVDYHVPDVWGTAAFVGRPDRYLYAGACILNPYAVSEIMQDERTVDFPAHLLGAHRYIVPGFLDVGTPEGFKLAQEWTE